MKKILQHLKENWIRHGFETIVVIVGVLIAFSLNNWNIKIRNKTLEEHTLKNLIIDLTLQKEIIQEQLDFEEHILEAIDSCFVMINSKIEVFFT